MHIGFFECKLACHKKQMCIVDTQNQVRCLTCTFYFVGSFFPLNIYKDFGLKYAQLFFESKIACDKKQMCIVDAQNHIRCLKTVCFGYCCSPLVIYCNFGFKYAHWFFECKFACHKKHMCIVDTKILCIFELLVLENLFGAGEGRKNYSWCSSCRDDNPYTSHNVLSEAG